MQQAVLDEALRQKQASWKGSQHLGTGLPTQNAVLSLILMQISLRMRKKKKKHTQGELAVHIQPWGILLLKGIQRIKQF